ncbi:MAG: hypothetical protein U1F59_09755 [Candidatus Competibacteraceae bacterium]
MFETIKMIVGLIPTLIPLLRTAEETIPGSGQGSTKLTLVREILEAVDAGIPAIWPIVEKVIAALVKAGVHR